MAKLLAVIVGLFLSLHASGDESSPSSNPFENVTIAASDIEQALVKEYQTDGKADYPSIFNALGALSGFGCQMAIREGFIKTGKISDSNAFVLVETKDGGRYFFGDFLNQPLLSTKHGDISVWALVGGAAEHVGAKQLPDIGEIVQHNASTVGSDQFGIPRESKSWHTRELPIDALKKNWQPMEALLRKDKVDPRVWGWTFAKAAQLLIVAGLGTSDAEQAAKGVMEAAIPMSKIDPAIIGIRY